MNNKIQKMGKGFITDTQQHYVDGEWVDIETVNIDLNQIDYGKMPIDKISACNSDGSYPEEGSILRVNDFGAIEWAKPENIFRSKDEELRSKYPGLEIAWKQVLEAIHEYEMVKKLVEDY